MAEAEEGAATLGEVFESGWEAQRKVDSGEMSSNSDDFKVCMAG